MQIYSWKGKPLPIFDSRIWEFLNKALEKFLHIMKQVRVKGKAAKVEDFTTLIFHVQYCPCPTLRNHFNYFYFRKKLFGKSPNFYLYKFIYQFTIISLLNFLLEIQKIFKCLNLRTEEKWKEREPKAKEPWHGHCGVNSCFSCKAGVMTPILQNVVVLI